jgi:hypothetical protein
METRLKTLSDRAHAGHGQSISVAARGVHLHVFQRYAVRGQENDHRIFLQRRET